MRRALPALLLLALGAFPAAATEAPVKRWSLIHDKSSLTFKGRQMGQPFEGSFSRYAADIAFDPDNLAASAVKVEIDPSAVSTGAQDRDELLQGKDWFDVTRFPAARFVTTGFRKAGDNRYEALANLTIRGITVPVTLPFTLTLTPADSEKKTSASAAIDGALTLDRSLFGLGGGTWADSSVIANEVTVAVHVFALLASPPKPKAR